VLLATGNGKISLYHINISFIFEINFVSLEQSMLQTAEYGYNKYLPTCFTLDKVLCEFYSGSVNISGTFAPFLSLKGGGGGTLVWKVFGIVVE
jgi:hypothetical protein